jgi:hypothetical protein
MASSEGCVYVGLAGETAPGREGRAGLYRSRGGEAGWDVLGVGLPPAPQVRAIVVDPSRPGRVRQLVERPAAPDATQWSAPSPDWHAAADR